MQSQPCITGTGPRTETCGGCFYRRWAPRDLYCLSGWDFRCLHQIGYRAPRSQDDQSCPNFKAKDAE